MQENGLHKLGKTELLTIIYEQEKQIQQLKNDVKDLNKQLEDRTIQIKEAGSIADASLKINKIFEAAQQAADEYLRSIKEVNRVSQENAEIIQKDITKDKESEETINQEKIQNTDEIVKNNIKEKLNSEDIQNVNEILKNDISEIDAEKKSQKTNESLDNKLKKESKDLMALVLTNTELVKIKLFKRITIFLDKLKTNIKILITNIQTNFISKKENLQKGFKQKRLEILESKEKRKKESEEKKIQKVKEKEEKKKQKLEIKDAKKIEKQRKNEERKLKKKQNQEKRNNEKLEKAKKNKTDSLSKKENPKVKEEKTKKDSNKKDLKNQKKDKSDSKKNDKKNNNQKSKEKKEEKNSKKAKNKFIEKIEPIVFKIKEKFSIIKNKIIIKKDALVEKIKSKYTKLKENIKLRIEKIKDFFYSKSTKSIEKIKNFKKNITNKLKNSCGRLKEKVNTLLEKIKNKFDEITKRIKNTENKKEKTKKDSKKDLKNQKKSDSEKKDKTKKNIKEFFISIFPKKEKFDVKNIKISLKDLEKELKRRKENANKAKFARTLTFSGVVIVAFTIIAATRIFNVLQVSGNSMEPSLYSGDLLISSKIIGYEKGDMIAFYYSNSVLIKRIVATEGDIVYLDDEGNLFVNSKKVEEKYVEKLSYGKCDIKFPYKVPDREVFVLGDNREMSIDSRSKALGSISEDKILGKITMNIKKFIFY